MTIAVAILAGLIAQAAGPARLPAECPRVTLSYSGGLGFEGRGGLVFAAWDSGVVVRATRFAAPAGRHVMGTVPAGEVTALADAVTSSPLWNGESLLAIDSGKYHVQLLRPDGNRMGRSETPDDRLSPALENIRRRVYGLVLTDPVRIAVPNEEPWECPATAWKE